MGRVHVHNWKDWHSKDVHIYMNAHTRLMESLLKYQQGILHIQTWSFSNLYGTAKEWEYLERVKGARIPEVILKKNEMGFALPGFKTCDIATARRTGWHGRIWKQQMRDLRKSSTQVNQLIFDKTERQSLAKRKESNTWKVKSETHELILIYQIT
jgi:hypothetical protein